MMTNEGYPLRFQVEPAPRMGRAHVVIRLVLLVVLGALGTSSVYWLLYLALPALAALMIAQHGAARFLADDADRGGRALRWVAGAYAYLWLLTDAAPSSSRDASAVELELQPGGEPTTTSALVRIVASLPAVVFLAVLSMVGAVLWVIGAISILAVERVPSFVSEFVTYKLRFQLRLFAYHLSFVGRYPSLGEAQLPRLAASST